MTMPVHVNFHNMERCDKLENAIFQHAWQTENAVWRSDILPCRHHSEQAP